MPAWRRNAIALFPERRRHVQTAVSIKDVLADLESAYLASSDAMLGDKIAVYVRRCLRAGKHDSFERVIIHECMVHWGADSKLRPLVRRCLSPRRFMQEYKVFEHRLNHEDFARVWADFVAERLSGRWLE